MRHDQQHTGLPEPPHPARVTYNLQYRRCKRTGCPSCAPDRPGHGPYWYAYWRENGRLRSRYLGKQPPVGAPAAPTAGDHILTSSAMSGAATDDHRPRSLYLPSGSGRRPDEHRGPLQEGRDAAGGVSPPTGPPASDRLRSRPARGLAQAPAHALRAQSLGGFRVWRGGEPLPDAAWSRRKASTLFKCLLDAPAHRLAREQAIDLLWPDALPGVAANNLKVTVHHLRRILDHPGATASHIRVEGETLVLLPHPYGDTRPDWWDAQAFTGAATSALSGRDVDACLAALALYGGEYLPEDRYEDWATARRQALQEQHLALLAHLANLRIARGEPEEAIRPLQTVLAADPCLEDAARTLMRLHAESGHHTEAIRVYRHLVQALERELGLGPDARTRALHQRVLAGRAAYAGSNAQATGLRGQPDGAQPVPARPAGERHALDAPSPEAPIQPATALDGAGSRTPLIARAAELAYLMRHLARARNGHGGLVLLRGAAGVGKSTLVAEFLRQARDGGTLILLGRAHLAEGGLPYGPVLEALRAYVAVQRPDLLARQCGQVHGSALLGVLPELAAALPSLPRPAALEPHAERHRLFAALGGLLQAIARGCPTVLVLEDLHWADATTVQALRYLQRTCNDGQLLLLGIYRPEELDSGGPLASLAESISRDSPEAVLDLRPLDVAATRALVASLLAPHPVAEEVGALVWGKCRGNPFFAGELVGALLKAEALVVRDGRWVLDAGGAVALPAGIRALIAERVDRLDPVVAHLLKLCAVLGKDIQHDLLGRVSDLGEERLLAAIDAALEAGVLAEQGGDGGAPAGAGGSLAYTFAHPLIPEALYQSIPPARRALLHSRVGAAIEALYGARAVERAADLAWHFGHAGQHEQAARYALVAGDRAAAAFATPEALAHYSAALAHLQTLSPLGAHGGGDLVAGGGGGLTPPQERSEGGAALLEERLGDLRLLVGEYDPAQGHFARARRAEPDPLRRAELARKEGVTLERRGEFDRALAAFDAAAAELVPGGLVPRPELVRDTWLPALAAIELSRGEVQYRRGEYIAAETGARQALALLRRAGATVADPRSRTLAMARADSLLGSVALDQGDHDQAMACFRRSLAAREGIGDQQGIGESWQHLGDVSYDRRDYGRAAECYRTALSLAERIGDQFGIAAAWNGLAIVARERGDMGAAEDGFRRALSIRERIGDQQGMAAAWNNLGNIFHLHGAYAEAEDAYRGSLTLAERIGDGQGIAIAWYNLGRVACERGDPSAAGLCRRARLLALRIGFPSVEARAVLETARLRLRGGRLRQAAFLLEHGRALVAAHHLARTGIAADLLAAELALAGGDPQAARVLAARALERSSADGLRLEAAQARGILGRCVRAGDDTDALGEAETQLRLALAELTAIGAAIEAARARLTLATVLAAPHLLVIPPRLDPPRLLSRASDDRRAEAATLLAAARSVFAAQGAALDLARADRLDASLS